jgi:tetratricopeptide (TPR) repeat protein
MSAIYMIVKHSNALLKCCGLLSLILFSAIDGEAAPALSGSRGEQPILIKPLGHFAPQESNLGKRVGAGDEKKEAKEEEGEGATPPATGSNTRRKNPSRKSSATQRVTFMTDGAGTQVLISGNVFGPAGSDGKLSIRLRPGTYTVTTRRNGQLSSPRTIVVAPGSVTTFYLVSNGTPPSTNMNASAPPANAASASAEEIIGRYLDPKQTNSVTAADWQRVVSLSHAELAQNPGNPQVKGQGLFAEGQVAFLRGDFLTALTSFNSAALTLPDSALAYYGLGNAYLATNQPAEAIRAYERALQLNKELAMAHKGIGDALTKQGKTKEAFKSYERARSLGVASSSDALSTAQAFIERKRWNEALRELNEVSKTKQTAEVYMLIGDCYLQLKQPLSAAQAYRRATELDGKSALAYFKYGDMMYDLREYQAALQALERSLALDPSGTTIKRERARNMVDNAAKKLGRGK